MTATVTEHVYEPRGASRALFECRAPEVLVSGPAGTGKSRGCLEKLHLMALVNPGMRGLIVRKTAVSLTSTALDTWEKHVVPEALSAGLVSWFGGSAREPAGAAAGRQHYVAWEIGDVAYRLQAWGHLDWEGARIDFCHRQVWSPPLAGCGNAYFGDRVCIKQFEVWSDNSGDPGGPLQERVRRDHILAHGIGPGFVVHDWRTGWHADLRYHWEW